MADEKNPSEVQDLLARLRSQMSQLDEMFGMDAKPSTEEETPSPAVSEQDALGEAAVFGEKSGEASAESLEPEEEEEAPPEADLSQAELPTTDEI